jgi:chromosomal replication initiation ATPase DnaA
MGETTVGHPSDAEERVSPARAYRFETFVVGPSNREAVAAAERAADAPGDVVNPLVIVADPGLGKTHLLHALAARARALHPGARVESTTASALVAESAVGGDSGAVAIEARAGDLVLIDDAHTLIDAGPVVEAVAALFTDWVDGGAQLVLATTRNAAELIDAHEAFADLIRRGSSVLLRTPDTGMRSRIAQEYARGQGVQLTENEVRAIAHASYVDVREIHSAVNALLIRRDLRSGAPGVDRVGARERPAWAARPLRAFLMDAIEYADVNAVALRAAEGVIAKPGAAFHPLFIQGPGGAGKTHLVHAIANVLARRDGMLVACLSARAFADALPPAGNAPALDAWRGECDALDVLVLDDAQALAESPRAQSELLHLLDRWEETGRQLVCTARSLPQMLALDPRLRSRLGGGLVVTLEQADLPLRARIAQQTLARGGLSPDDDVVRRLAEHARTAREAVLAAQRLVVAAEVSRAALTPRFVQDVLGAAPEPLREDARQTPVDPSFFDREKVVLDWTDLTDRLIEEFR